MSANSAADPSGGLNEQWSSWCQTTSAGTTMRDAKRLNVGWVPAVRFVTGDVNTTPLSPASAGRKPAAVTVEILPLLVPTNQTGLFQRLTAALMKPCNSAACVALRRVAKLRPVGCAGAASAIMTLRPWRRKRSAERIRKLPVEVVIVPVASRLSKPSPPVIKTTLARPACAGLSRRTGGVLTIRVVSIVTASASAARAAGASLPKAKATPAANINED